MNEDLIEFANKIDKITDEMLDKITDTILKVCLDCLDNNKYPDCEKCTKLYSIGEGAKYGNN